MNNQVRIIAGSLRGRKITFSEISQENALRPTSDRIRETLFNWLSPAIINAECLDAFAGSGALGFEAISRAAKHVTLIEKCPQTLKNIQQNAEHFKIDSSVLTSLCSDTITYLNQTPKTFDIIFLDPPFKSDLLQSCIQIIAKRNLLNPEGYLYIEHAEPSLPEKAPQNWIQIRAKKAGSVYYELWRAHVPD